MKRRLSNEEIIALYESGVLIEELLAKSQYKDRSSIYRILKKNGVIPDRNPRISLSNKDISEIVTLYESSPTISALKIDEMYKISDDTVLRILRDNGATIRKQPRKHIINEEFFEEISPEVLYVVGIIQTDGTIHKNLLGFSIIQKDIELLEKIALEMGATTEIIYYGNNDVLVLIVKSKKMVQSLMERFKLHPNKSKSITFPSIPETLIPSMLRGIFDGDGHFQKREAGFVTASESFALSFYDILNKLQLDPKLNLEKPNVTWLFRVYVRGENNLRKLENILYSDGSNLYKVEKKIKLLNAYK
jgi:hypothetical protein